MTLLKRIVAEHRVASWTLAVVLVLDVLAYALVLYPLERRSAGAADRAARAAVALQAAQREEEAAMALISGQARAQEDLAAFYDKVLSQDFVTARTLTYSLPPALARKANLRYLSGSFSDDQGVRGGRFGRLQAKIMAQGDYEALRRFIFDLEMSSEFVITDSVALVQSDVGKALTFDVELSIYYRRPHVS
jgi:hypothetical protein